MDSMWYDVMRKHGFLNEYKRTEVRVWKVREVIHEKNNKKSCHIGYVLKPGFALACDEAEGCKQSRCHGA